MSHVVLVDMYIMDLDALSEAAALVGTELARGQETYRWYGKHVGDYPLPAGFALQDLGKCQHALRVPGDSRAYEIGVVRRRDGKPGYTLIWDFYAGGHGMQKLVGKECLKLQQAYAAVVAKRQALRQGYRVTQHTRADGFVVVELVK